MKIGKQNKIEEELNQLEAEIQREQELLDKVSFLIDYTGEDELITSQQMWELYQEELKRNPLKIQSKIPILDKKLEGFREGDLIVISGITGEGKTTLCQTLTTNFHKQDIMSLWFSYELKELEFLQKFPQPLPAFALPKKLQDNSLMWIEKKIMEGIAKFGVKAVFIDHLHHLLDMNTLGRQYNTSLIIGGMMRELKKIALNWNVCIFLVAHTTKIKFEEKPDLSSIRDSSFISQEADTVLAIWRHRDKKKANRNFTNESRLSVLKNRRTGQLGIIKLALIGKEFKELQNDIKQKYS